VTILFIYAYHELATGKDVYVGSAVDVAARDAVHRSAGRRCNCVPFDREIQRRGRDVFGLRIVEALTASCVTDAMKAGAARENQWMDVLGTYRTATGFNFCRAGVAHRDEAQWAAAKAARKAGQKRAFARPDVKEKLSSAARRVWANPETRARQSERMRAKWTPEARSRQSSTMKTVAAEVQNRPDVKAKQAETRSRQGFKERHLAATTAAQRRPDIKAKQSAAQKRLWTIEARTRHSALLREALKDGWSSEAKARHSETMKAVRARRQLCSFLALGDHSLDPSTLETLRHLSVL